MFASELLIQFLMILMKHILLLDEAVLEYVNRKGTLDMYHTEVPDAYRGQGLAAMLAKVFKHVVSPVAILSGLILIFFKAAFDHAVENHLPMKLSCSYLQKYFKENPKDEYKKLVV